MSEEAGFLAETLKNPPEIGNRVAYADWLMEHEGRESEGEFLGKLLKFQNAQGRERVRLGREIEAHPGLGELLPGRMSYSDRHNDLVWTLTEEELTAPANRNTLGVYAPLMTVTVSGYSIDPTVVAESPNLHHITKLSLAQMPVGTAGVQTLITSPHLDNLTHLDLTATNISAGAISALAQSRNAGKLLHLNVSYNNIGQDGIKRLTGSGSKVTQLQELVLSETGINAEAMLCLPTWPHAKNLRYLNLSHNRLNRTAVSRLTNLESLTGLNLSDTHLGTEEMRILTAEPRMPSLTSLDISQNPLTNESASILAASPHFPNLRDVNIEGTRIGTDGISAMVQSKNLPKLRYVGQPHLLPGGEGWTPLDELDARNKSGGIGTDDVYFKRDENPVPNTERRDPKIRPDREWTKKSKPRDPSGSPFSSIA